MPHVSPRKVDEKILEKLYGMLFLAVSYRNISRKDQRLAFSELLTPTEKIMLSKRLAAVSMLAQGQSRYKVGKTLQLSETTAAKIQLKIEQGKYTKTVGLCAVLRKGPFQRYIDNLLKPLPKYGTGPASVFKNR